MDLVSSLQVVTWRKCSHSQRAVTGGRAGTGVLCVPLGTVVINLVLCVPFEVEVHELAVFL